MLPHTDRGLQDKRARDQILDTCHLLKKTTLSALRRCVEKGVCGPRDDAPIMGRESARSSHKRCLVHTCGYGSTMRSDDTMFIQIKSIISLEVFHIRVFIHSYSIGFIQCDMDSFCVMISRQMQIVGRKAARNKFQFKKTPTVY